MGGSCSEVTKFCYQPRLDRFDQYETSVDEREARARRSHQTLERSSSMFAEQMSSVLQPYDGVLRPVSHSPKYYKYRIAPHVYFKVRGTSRRSELGDTALKMRA